MAAKLGQVSIPAPGAQGLNSEVSPFSGETQWALKADNAVVDRVGRLASREAFADLTTGTQGFPDEYDVVRLTRLETEANIQYADRTEYGTALYGLSEYSGNGFRQKTVQDLTFGLAATIGTACSAMGDLFRNGDANNLAYCMSDTAPYTSIAEQDDNPADMYAMPDYGNTPRSENTPGYTDGFWTSNMRLVPANLAPCERNAAGLDTYAMHSNGRNSRIVLSPGGYYGPESGTSTYQNIGPAPTNPELFLGTLKHKFSISAWLTYDPENIDDDDYIELVDVGQPNFWTMTGGNTNAFFLFYRFEYYPKTGLFKVTNGGNDVSERTIAKNMVGWFTFSVDFFHTMTGGEQMPRPYKLVWGGTQSIEFPDGEIETLNVSPLSVDDRSATGWTSVGQGTGGSNKCIISICWPDSSDKFWCLAFQNNLDAKTKEAFTRHMEGYVDDPDRPKDYSSYFGFRQDSKTLTALPLTTKNGVTKATLVPFKDSIYVFSKGEEVQRYDGTDVTKLSDDPFYFPPQDDQQTFFDICDGDVACSAYGRLWVSGCDGDYQTIYYSDMLRPEQWYDGRGVITDDSNSAGIISVAEYWPSGGDKIQGIAAHNGFLVVFGRESILIYSGAKGDPAGDPNTGFGGL